MGVSEAPTNAYPPPSATETPYVPRVVAGASFCVCAHEVPDRTNTYAAPGAPFDMSFDAPTMAVSPARATEKPNVSPGAPSEGTSVCCKAQVVPDRTKTYAAPAATAIAVSPLSATLAPAVGHAPASAAPPRSSVCWRLHVGPAPTKTCAALPAPTIAVPPSSATDPPKTLQAEAPAGSTICAAFVHAVPDRVKTVTLPSC